MRASKIIFATVFLLAIPFVQLAIQEINAVAALFGNAQLPDNHMEEHHTHQENKGPTLEHSETETQGPLSAKIPADAAAQASTQITDNQTAIQVGTELAVNQTAATQDAAANQADATLQTDNHISNPPAADLHLTEQLTANQHLTDHRMADNRAEDLTATESDIEVPNGKFTAINDIELTDTPDTIKSKLGRPEQITEDPDLPDFYTYHYNHMNIGFSGETLQFVEFVKNGEAMQLGDGTPLSFNIEEIRRVLGEPDLESEDGIAYRDDYRALKFYYDETGQNIRSAHYFHLYTS